MYLQPAGPFGRDHDDPDYAPDAHSSRSRAGRFSKGNRWVDGPVQEQTGMRPLLRVRVCVSQQEKNIYKNTDVRRARILVVPEAAFERKIPLVAREYG